VGEKWDFGGWCMIFWGFGEVVVVCEREEGGVGLKKIVNFR
jgi:hypothetical protein